MRKFIIYKEFDVQQEDYCMRAFIGRPDDYAERKAYIESHELEIYNDCGEELKTDEEYEQFIDSIEGQLKLKCNFKR